jgi:imidazolonepropionase-like amidohydrolase
VQPTITAARFMVLALVFALAVIAEGAYAERILVDGNPLENHDLVADHDGKCDLIMKDGKIYKDTQ